MLHRGLYSDRGLRSAIRYFDLATAMTHREANGSHASPRGDTLLDRPLAGVTVIELGQYTTAPFVARHLGALGAEVLKIEPPGGDATRRWPPQRDGLGYFFSLSNSDKRSLCLDLRTQSDRARFSTLLSGADVLVENLKPGSLKKLGFGDDRRAAINPRLVYCAISGFGADSAYPGRPAFDTVIQAMSGIMDSIRQNDRPQKAGISLADILGGLFALTGTLSVLLERSATGIGDALDISMQDAAAWITQWTDSAAQDGRVATLRCGDGYVVAMASSIACDPAESRSRAEVAEELSNRGIQAAPVLTIDEVARSEQARVRKTLVPVHDSADREWQVFNTPIRLSTTPCEVRRAIGPLGEVGNL
jgi:crotonobetainyl-CoA:carnitine CoA-transferase CaiB-like acyl-CoA transferase